MEIRDIKKYLNKNFDVIPVKGKFTNLMVKGQSTELKRVYLLKNPRLSRQMCFLYTKKQVFCGCILARQSSDFMVELVKQVIKNVIQSFDKIIDKTQLIDLKKIKINLIQLRFPNDFQSLKLIVITPLEDIKEIADMLELYESIGKNMKEKIKKIVKM